MPFDVADAYLQLPEVPPRVRALAEGIAAEEPTTFDKVRAVEDWIHDNTTVTDDAAPVPAGADPLETFLFDARSGPPERAAGAMAVMLRAVGVPARVAVGFLPGRRDGPDDPFAVRLSDTHAWVEVWFPTVGWQRFDPTGRAPNPRAEEESVWDRLLRFLDAAVAPAARPGAGRRRLAGLAPRRPATPARRPPLGAPPAGGPPLGHPLLRPAGAGRGGEGPTEAPERDAGGVHQRPGRRRPARPPAGGGRGAGDRRRLVTARAGGRGPGPGRAGAAGGHEGDTGSPPGTGAGSRFGRFRRR